MATSPAILLEELCRAGHSFHQRGLAHGSTGNLSVRIGDSIFITPTGGSLGAVTPADLAELSLDGQVRNARAPSKEAPFHLGLYRARLEATAVVHLHSFWSVALSCLGDLSPQEPGGEPVAALTPYYFMRVAPLGILPYFRPGDSALGDAVARAAADHHCLLLRNHGTISCGANLGQAIDRTEELEATARLHFALRGEKTSALTAAQLAELRGPVT
jgi:ribulose-5-phosphate 4-epimerase/fuculose-1-phosphate aldolase